MQNFEGELAAIFPARRAASCLGDLLSNALNMCLVYVVIPVIVC